MGKKLKEKVEELIQITAMNVVYEPIDSLTISCIRNLVKNGSYRFGETAKVTSYCNMRTNTPTLRDRCIVRGMLKIEGRKNSRRFYWSIEPNPIGGIFDRPTVKVQTERFKE